MKKLISLLLSSLVLFSVSANAKEYNYNKKTTTDQKVESETKQPETNNTGK